MKRYPFTWISGLVSGVLWIAEVVLGLRFLLKLFAANPEVSFVQWIYAISQPLLGPFEGIFASPALEEGIILEFSTLFAILFYEFLRFVIESSIYWIREGYIQHHEDNQKEGSVGGSK